MQSTLDHFVDEIDAFLARSGMSPTAFGKAALGDPRFVFDIRAGRAPTMRVADRVQEFIRTHERAAS